MEKGKEERGKERESTEEKRNFDVSFSNITKIGKKAEQWLFELESDLVGVAEAHIRNDQQAALEKRATKIRVEDAGRDGQAIQP